ncbi:hypothetical protein GF358_00585 [Candidatus Woesearchaeota archaeon]|nr:hypothetical protein [Candidatus Woesearchaeota archaeon]
MKRVFIVHGWGGHPSEGWFPWLKKKLEARGFKVEVPEMPNTDEPDIKEWVSFLKNTVGSVDSDTYFIGHSVGCQTILRYLESIDTKVGGVVLVAGWFNLTPETFEEEGAEEIAMPWISTPIDFEKVNANCEKFLCVFSDNDPYVPLSDIDIFREKLNNVEVVVQEKKGHFSGEDGIKELPVVLEFFRNL